MEGFLLFGGKKMLELKDVGFAYGNGVPVLENMNLIIREGEFIGLGGRNGCGKTTVTRLMMGLEKPSKGQILIDDRDVTATEPSKKPLYRVCISKA